MDIFKITEREKKNLMAYANNFVKAVREEVYKDSLKELEEELMKMKKEGRIKEREFNLKLLYIQN